jgi:ppGpp synthetase/RelA/SpoT-type nucleotidyltranferase
MLTDVSLKHLKPKDKIYKIADRDGMYVAVAPTGQITFRYDYRLNGRRETLTIGRYGSAGVSLAEARELCVVARRMVAVGHSPAQEKQREKRRLSVAQNFGGVGKRWFKEARMAESTRAMRKAIFDRDILPVWDNRFLTEKTSFVETDRIRPADFLHEAVLVNVPAVDRRAGFHSEPLLRGFSRRLRAGRDQMIPHVTGTVIDANHVIPRQAERVVPANVGDRVGTKSAFHVLMQIECRERLTNRFAENISRVRPRDVHLRELTGAVGEFDLFREAARLTQERCETLLNENGIRAIVTSRAKRPDGAAEKAKARNKRRQQRRKYKTIPQIFKDIVDLAGVRIALYFPGDAEEVGRLLEQHFEILRVKNFPERKGQGKKSRRVYQKRFSGYRALHYLVCLKSEALSDEMKRFAQVRIEIQIASVLMHSWAEVEHDLAWLQGQQGGRVATTERG